MSKGFDHIIDHLLLTTTTCDCRKGTLYDYEAELRRIGAKPIDLEASWSEMIFYLDNFDETRVRPGNNCPSCDIKFKKMIREVQIKVEDYFQGLCLDCMFVTRSPTAIDDRDYSALQRNPYNVRKTCNNDHGWATTRFSHQARVKRHG